MKRLIVLLAAVLCLALMPAAAFANPSLSGQSTIYANGTPIKVVAGTTDGHTNILWDKNNDGTIADDEYMTIGSEEPTAAGYDLTLFNIYGGKAGEMTGDTSVTMTGGSVANVFGGGDSLSGAVVNGSTSVIISGGTVKGVYGGGYNSDSVVNGNTSVIISGGTLTGVHAGSFSGSVTGQRSLTISGSPVISRLVTNTNECVTISGGTFGCFDGDDEPRLAKHKSYYAYLKATDKIGTFIETYALAKTEAGAIEDGKWVIVSDTKYKVTYDKTSASGGVAPGDWRSYVYGDEAEVRGNTGSLRRDGYSFAGWNTQLDGNGTSYQPGKKLAIEGNVTLYAQWDSIDYAIEFDANGGSGTMDDLSFTADESKELTAGTFTRTGYGFFGWNLARNGSSTPYPDKATVTCLASSDGETITLYAQWEPITYHVLFDANGGDGDMESQFLIYDRSAALTASAFTKENHSFTGWSTVRDGSGALYSDGATVGNLASSEGAVVTLYAQWRPNSYAVTFDTDGGSDVAPQSVEYGKTATEPEDPEKPGYRFGGWYADAELTAEYDFSAAVTAPVTVYAKWDAVYYPTIPQPCPLDDYDDLDRRAWYHDGVHWAIGSGIMTGTHDAVWEPETATTRAMVAMALYRMAGEPDKTGNGAWYSDAMAWAVGSGIFRGYGNDPSNLGPNDPVTREQLATVLCRYSQWRGDDVSAASDLSAYPDASEVGPWAVDAMRWAVAEGIVQGRGGTLLAPAGGTERAELATMIWRMTK